MCAALQIGFFSTIQFYKSVSDQRPDSLDCFESLLVSEKSFAQSRILDMHAFHRIVCVMVMLDDIMCTEQYTDSTKS